MIHHLTPSQLSILRRSRTGLRFWEEGAALQALHDQLRLLVRLGLVDHDEALGYQLTPQGEACLLRLDG